MKVYTTATGYRLTLTRRWRIPCQPSQHPDSRAGKIFTVNTGYWDNWTAGAGLPGHLRKPTADKPNYSPATRPCCRFHRTLLYGGVSCIQRPQGPKKTQGKLRLLYEVNPLAFICEQAGGAASTGLGRVMDLEPEHLHQRVPVYMGSKYEVELVEKFFRGEKP